MGEVVEEGEASDHDAHGVLREREAPKRGGLGEREYGHS
jgi:hypothetical protein